MSIFYTQTWNVRSVDVEELANCEGRRIVLTLQCSVSIGDSCKRINDKPKMMMI